MGDPGRRRAWGIYSTGYLLAMPWVGSGFFLKCVPHICKCPPCHAGFCTCQLPFLFVSGGVLGWLSTMARPCICHHLASFLSPWRVSSLAHDLPLWRYHLFSVTNARLGLTSWLCTWVFPFWNVLSPDLGLVGSFSGYQAQWRCHHPRGILLLLLS